MEAVEVVAIVALGLTAGGLLRVWQARGREAWRMLCVLALGTLSSTAALALETGPLRLVLLLVAAVAVSPLMLIPVVVRLGPRVQTAVFSAIKNVFPGVLPDPSHSSRVDGAVTLAAAQARAALDPSPAAWGEVLRLAVGLRDREAGAHALRQMGGIARLSDQGRLLGMIQVARSGTVEDLLAAARFAVEHPTTGAGRVSEVALLLAHLGAPDEAVSATLHLSGLHGADRLAVRDLYRGLALLRRGDLEVGLVLLASLPPTASPILLQSARALIESPPEPVPRRAAASLIARLASDVSLRSVFIGPTLIAVSAVLVGVFLAQTAVGTDTTGLLLSGASVTPLLAQEPWRLVSAITLHAHTLHLGTNMLGLWMIGPEVIRRHRSARAVTALVVCGVAGNLASWAWHDMAVGVGASGGLMGGLGVILGSTTSSAPTVLLVVALEVVLAFTVEGLDNAAHLGGLAAGLGLARLWRRSPGRWALVSSALSTAIVGWASVHAVTWQLRDLPTVPTRVGEWVVDMPVGFVAVEEAWLVGGWSWAQLYLPPEVYSGASAEDALGRVEAEVELPRVSAESIRPWHDGVRRDLVVQDQGTRVHLGLHTRPIGDGYATLLTWTDDPRWREVLTSTAASARLE